VCCRQHTYEQNSLSLCFFGRKDNTNQGGSTNIAPGASTNQRDSTNYTVTKDSTNQGIPTTTCKDSMLKGDTTTALKDSTNQGELTTTTALEVSQNTALKESTKHGIPTTAPNVNMDQGYLTNAPNENTNQGSPTTACKQHDSKSQRAARQVNIPLPHPKSSNPTSEKKGPGKKGPGKSASKRKAGQGRKKDSKQVGTKKTRTGVKCIHAAFRVEDYTADYNPSYYKEAYLQKHLYPLANCAGTCNMMAKDVKVGAACPIHICCARCHDNPSCTQFFCHPCFKVKCNALNNAEAESISRSMASTRSKRQKMATTRYDV